jgi:hypothetical protein
MRCFASLLLAAVVIAGAWPAHADDDVGESLDWLLTVRPSIAVEEVTSTAPVTGSGFSNRIKIETTVKKVLKGAPPEKASFERRWQPMGVPGQDDTARPAKGTEYLLFFDEHGGVTNAINLKYPSRKVGLGADPSDVALNDDFTIFKSGDLIMDAVYERLAWLKDHPLPPPDPAASKDNVPAGAVALSVPMTSPAWDVLYSGISDQCSLLIPADMKNGGGRFYDSKQAPYELKFTGPVMPADCNPLPEADFRIKSAISGAPHTLSVACHDTRESNYPNMTVDFKIFDALHDADYGFEWGSNPDDLSDPTGYFAKHKEMCAQLARVMMFRVPRGKPIPPSATNPRPMYAAWEVECIPNDRLGFVLEFLLSIRSTPDSAAEAATQPVASVSTVVMKNLSDTDVVVLAKHKPPDFPTKPKPSQQLQGQDQSAPQQPQEQDQSVPLQQPQGQ